MLPADPSKAPTPARHHQQPGPFSATSSARTLLLTGEEEAGLSNLSSPSIVAARTDADGGPTGGKFCLATENHWRFLAKG